MNTFVIGTIAGILAILITVLLVLFVRKELLGERKRMAGVLSLVLVLSSVGLYAYWSDFYKHYINPFNADEQTQFLANFEQHLLQNPSTGESWVLLANMYAARAQHSDAVRAFHIAEEKDGLAPDEKIQYAEERFLAAGQRFDGTAIRLLDEAVQEAPDDQKGLWLSGFAYFSTGDYARAIALWQNLLKFIQDQPKVLVQVEQQIIDAKELLAEQRRAPKSAPTKSKTQEPAQEPTQETQEPGVVITVDVKLSPDLQERVSGEETLFVYARAATGMPAPLAIKRLRASQLPMQITLSQNDAMIKTMKLQDFAQVKIIARISRSGQARTQSGDLIGESEAVDPSTSPKLSVTIDQLVP